MAQLEAFVDRVKPLAPDTRMLTQAELLERVPVLKAGYVAGGALEPSAMDIDIATAA